ncbi:MAG: FkbM family methyltransferase [Methylococcaceae bacterium]
MKQLIKKIIPHRIMPLAQRIFRTFFAKSSKSDFSKEQYDSLTALKCSVSYNKYGGYCVPESSRHRPAARKILAHDIHEPKTIEFLISHCGNGDIVHAGTYFGDFLPALSKACIPSAKVWAFEPNPENYRCAKITIQINDLKNVELANAGLGAQKETLLMKISDENGQALGGASRISGKDSSDISGGIEPVDIVTIDDSVGSDRHISIIQLDVEGHEKQALSGALKTIQRCLPIIIVEILPDSTLLESDWFATNIQSLGYKIFDMVHGNTIFISAPEK